MIDSHLKSTGEHQQNYFLQQLAPSGGSVGSLPRQAGALIGGLWAGDLDGRSKNRHGSGLESVPHFGVGVTRGNQEKSHFGGSLVFLELVPRQPFWGWVQMASPKQKSILGSDGLGKPTKQHSWVPPTPQKKDTLTCDMCQVCMWVPYKGAREPRRTT